MDTVGGEHFPYSAMVPGTPAPRAAADSRVVAVGQSPITTSNITRLVSRGAPAFHPTASLLPASHCVTPDPSTCVYVPIRHVHTGERAMVPLHVHPITGACTPAAPPPNGFLPAPADGADKSPNFLQWLAGLLCSLDAKLELAKIYNWIVNSVAFGRLRDSTAHFLLTSPGWHAVLTGGHPVMIQANELIPCGYLNNPVVV